MNVVQRGGVYRRLPQFLASWIAAKTSKTTAANHIKKESQPVVIIAPPTNNRARAASRSAGVSGHCGARGAVIAILFIKR